MTIAIGSDHAGYDLKEKVKTILQNLGQGVLDYGTHDRDSVDYPDYAFKVANAVVSGEVNRGVAVCKTGNGMTIATNKVKGIRATLCLSKEMAYYARFHNDSNLLTLSQKFTDANELEDILKTWLDTEFEGGRHIPRLEKIKKAEQG